MKTEITGYIGIGLCAGLLLAAHVTASDKVERNKREFVPIRPTNFIKQKPFATFVERKRVKVELPKHGENRVYYGPDGSLFPKISFELEKQVD